MAALPTFEAARAAGRYAIFTNDFYRLYWTLIGPLDSAIFVMSDQYYDPQSPLVPYCDKTGASPAWHSVSQAPLTDFKISAINVSLECLDDWENQWMEIHDEHGENARLFPESGWSAQFGPRSNDDNASDSEKEHGTLLRCCGEDRPFNMNQSLMVKAAGDFVTVHDYVSVVHPWLIGLRQQILRAAGNLEELEPLPQDTKLMVDYVWASPHLLNVSEEEQWRKSRSKKAHQEYMDMMERERQYRVSEAEKALKIPDIKIYSRLKSWKEI